MTFPYDSFNVEDLHTVDEGVITHLFPLLKDKSNPFDFLIGHFLGVDHVGHRVGPDHPSMKSKLEQMNRVLQEVVDLLDDDTLLVVLGDHGMDRSGDHGGDGVLETSTAMWVYSKGPPLTRASNPVPSGLLQYRTFPGTTVEHRGVQQIDILPTLSLLLGLPIPFNNLGTIIPEFFWRDNQGKSLEKALQLNVDQVYRYLQAYRSSPSGGELDEAWRSIQEAWGAPSLATSTEMKLITLNNFNKMALSACRAMWAQFDPVLMAMGLVLLGMGLCASWALFVGISNAKSAWGAWLKIHLTSSLYAGAGGAVAGIVESLASLILPSIHTGQNIVDYTMFGAVLASSVSMIIASPPLTSLPSLSSIPIVLILHSIAFLSNSFTFWEDRIVPFLAVSSLVPYAVKGFTAPTSRLRYRIVGFSLLYAACVRLVSLSTICREEQQPYCHVTFYASSSQTSPPYNAVLLALPTALALSLIIRRFLNISRSDRGVAKTHYPLIFTPAVVSGALFWILEWADTTSALGPEWDSTTLRFARTWIARFGFTWVLLMGGALWYIVPLCIDITVKHQGGQKQVEVIGYANAFGSPYLVFWTILLAVVYSTSQLPGQLVLSVCTVALLAYLEVVDSVRDVETMEMAFKRAKPSDILNSTRSDPNATDAGKPKNYDHEAAFKFGDVVPVALLGLHAFYGTGHQSTISSIQWKAAFMLSSTVVYPWSALTVVINSIGPIFLFALAAPLLALWNRAPEAVVAGQNDTSKDEREQEQELELDTRVKGDSILAGLGMMIYYTALLLGASVSAAILRRHLMVWKVFAPRFMAGVLGLLVVDLGVLIGQVVGVERVTKRVKDVFGKMSSPRPSVDKAR
ncbi:hypothetical protein MD484_g1533, partial [Candolleomyces efflorescens]